MEFGVRRGRSGKRLDLVKEAACEEAACEEAGWVCGPGKARRDLAGLQMSAKIYLLRQLTPDHFCWKRSFKLHHASIT